MKVWLPEWLAAAAKDIRMNLSPLWLAVRDRRTPLAAKIIAALVTAYAFSPIDLIPDFIPVIGLVDDLIIVPMGIFIAIRMIPKPLMEEFRVAASTAGRRPVSWIGAAFVVLIWIAILTAAGMWAMHWINGP